MLSGSSVHAYDGEVKHLAPNAHTFRTLHYAHRKAQEEESREAGKFSGAPGIFRTKKIHHGRRPTEFIIDHKECLF